MMGITIGADSGVRPLARRLVRVGGAIGRGSHFLRHVIESRTATNEEASSGVDASDDNSVPAHRCPYAVKM
jgi:hypothetical protein